MDEWELRREDVELMKTKRLGEGAFGEVCRALLQPKAMHKMSHRKKAPDRKYTMNCVVAVKMLKGVCTLYTCGCVDSYIIILYTFQFVSIIICSLLSHKS